MTRGVMRGSTPTGRYTFTTHMVQHHSCRPLDCQCANLVLSSPAVAAATMLESFALIKVVPVASRTQGCRSTFSYWSTARIFVPTYSPPSEASYINYFVGVMPSRLC
jgi:hypothetical protein